HEVALSPRFATHVLFLNHAAGRVWNAAAMLFGHIVAALPRFATHVLLSDHPAGCVRHLAGVDLALIVAALPAFVAALLLRDHAAGCVRARFHDRVRHLAADGVRHAGRHRFAAAVRLANRPHFAARHADRLAHPVTRALHLFLNDRARAVAR